MINEVIAKPIKTVTPAKAGVQKVLKILDSRLRGNDNPGLLHLAQMINNVRDSKVPSPHMILGRGSG